MIACLSALQLSSLLIAEPPPRGHGVSKSKEAAARAATLEHDPSPAGLDRLNQMNPAEREANLQNLDPERRQRLLKKLDEFNRLPEDQRRQLQAEYQRFRQLPDDRRLQIREQAQRVLSLPADRQQRLKGEFAHLRSLSTQEKAARFDSEEFRKQFDAKERDILKNLDRAVPPDLK